MALVDPTETFNRMLEHKKKSYKRVTTHRKRHPQIVMQEVDCTSYDPKTGKVENLPMVNLSS